MLAAQRILKSAIACSSRTMPGFAEGAVTIFMSALPPKADMCGATRDVRYGPIATFAHSFDHLAGPEGQFWRDVQSDHVGGLEVDYQLVLGRCLNRQFARFLAPQNAIGIGCCPSPLIDLIRPIGLAKYRNG